MEIKNPDLPSRVTIELTNRCNRHCDGCPRLKTNYPLGNMSWRLLKSIVEQLPSETVIVPFFRGESFLYQRFCGAMKLLSKFDDVQIATNGDNLTPSTVDTILNNCTFVSYSIHRFGYPYEDDFRKVVNFLDDAKKHDLSTQVSILNTMIPNNESIKKKFIDCWLEYADRVRIYLEHSFVGYGDVKPEYRVIKELKPCNKPFEDMVVYWDGKVAICNHDWNNPDPLGDLNVQSIEKVWKGEKYRQVREIHQACKFKQLKTCKDCDHWMVRYLSNKMFGELYTHEKGSKLEES